MPSFLDEYDIKKMALFAVFIIAVIGIIYFLTMTPFTIPQITPTTAPEQAATDCGKLEQPQKDFCYNIQAISLNDFGECNKIQDENLHDSCILGIALQQKSTLSCNELSGIQAKNQCYSMLATETAEDSCLKITEQAIKDQCYFNLSNKTINPETCKQINDLNLYNACFLGTSLLKSNGIYSNELCNSLTQPDRKNLCFSDLAVQEKNKSICELITENQDLKDNCITNVEAQQ